MNKSYRFRNAQNDKTCVQGVDAFTEKMTFFLPFKPFCIIIKWSWFLDLRMYFIIHHCR